MHPQSFNFIYDMIFLLYSNFLGRFCGKEKILTIANITGTQRTGARPGAPREIHELRHCVAEHRCAPQPLVQGHQGLQAPQAWGEEESDPSPTYPPSCLMRGFCDRRYERDACVLPHKCNRG